MLQYIRKNIRPNYVYVMASPSYPWRAKVGFSNAPKWRAVSIKDTIKQETGKAVQIYRFALPLYFAEKNEKAIHAACDRLYISATMPGSGRTEWFYFVNIFTALIAALVFWANGIECPLVRALIIAVLPLPLDFIIFVSLLALFQYALIGAAVWAAFQIF